MEERELKTKPCVRRAKDNYIAKFDVTNVNLPKGSKEIIRKTTGKSINAYINELVKEDMLAKYGISI